MSLPLGSLLSKAARQSPGKVEDNQSYVRRQFRGKPVQPSSITSVGKLIQGVEKQNQGFSRGGQSEPCREFSHQLEVIRRNAGFISTVRLGNLPAKVLE